MRSSRVTAVMCAAVALTAVAAASLSAHHNMRAAFDLNTRLTRTGTLTRIEWFNPHIHLFVDTQDDQGQAERWSFEGPAPGRLQANRPAIEASVGRSITVEASPARSGDRSGLIRELRLAEGQVIGLCPQNC
ncbi:MAG: DUF6152 family protein [Gemmatimonadota bacterium]